MKTKSRFFDILGFVVMGGAFMISLIWVLSRSSEKKSTELKTLRFAHWQLESGIREGFDAVAKEYMKRHPDVKLVQMPVPERVYVNWLRTQLIGKTSPDLILIKRDFATDEILSRYFIPITPLVSQPNPYNQGTALEGVAWKELLVQISSNIFLLLIRCTSSGFFIIEIS